MLILSRVCADFRNREGRVIFRIAPTDRLTFLEAPEEIRGDPLFDMLLSEGSLEAVQSVSQQKQLEADPIRETDATGKRRTPKTPRKKESGPANLPGSSEPTEKNDASDPENPASESLPEAAE